MVQARVTMLRASDSFWLDASLKKDVVFLSALVVEI
jgi:hypothetical protein